MHEDNYPKMRAYFRDVQDFIGLNKKQIMEEVGQRADHCFRWNSSQWDIPTEETYDELIRHFRINKYRGFKPYDELRQVYEQETAGTGIK